MRLTNGSEDNGYFKDLEKRSDHKGIFKPYMENISPYIEGNNDVEVVHLIIINTDPELVFARSTFFL